MTNNIKALRQELRMSQTSLAKEARVSRPYLSDLENGKAMPSIDTAKRISVALNDTIDHVFFSKMSYMVDNRKKETT